MRKVEVIILSGFLGSGKSTLLKEVIDFEQKNGKRLGVLMNELGDISIDSAVIPMDTPLKEMLNGCICCTLQGELSLQLSQMLEVYELDLILIEATGAAHPLEILEACTHPTLISKVEIRCIVTVINAKQWIENRLSIKLKKLLVEQVRHADVVLVNKVDQVDEDEIPAVTESVKKINTQAEILTVTFAKMNFSILYDRVVKSNEKLNEIEQAHVHHHLHLRTISLSVNQPIDRIAFLQWLEKIEGRLHRVKGFIYLTETPGLYLFNYAYEMPIFERYATEKYEPVLVFIGEELNRGEIEEGLGKLQRII
ncbi:CobW family GTP-binding protein [Alkalihalobacterium sp. APHAB7]|uniref:CobW family GTP-binding protein n=1 Tax=Alkalihalobacterium sp. APHAB7 TaxID=3402081 RepID=UPI003AAB33A7